MSNYTDLFPGGAAKVRRILRYTTGTGTFTPLVADSLCVVTLVGAGGSNSASTGGGGETRQFRVRLTGAQTYLVPAASPGATNQAGGDAVLGTLRAQGGQTTAGGNYGGGWPGIAGNATGDGAGSSVYGLAATVSVVAGPGGGGLSTRPSGAGLIIVEEYGAV